MPSCEKCWNDSKALGVDYYELARQRNEAGKPCRAEEQAGNDARTCPQCDRRTVHQICGVCMVTGCGYDEANQESTDVH